MHPAPILTTSGKFSPLIAALSMTRSSRSSIHHQSSGDDGRLASDGAAGMENREWS